MQTIGFIGVGNMGGALASAVCKTVDPKTVFLADVSIEKMQTLADALHCNVLDALTVAKTCDYIFLGVKPQMLSALFEEIGAALKENPRAVLISMAAGVPLARLETLAGDTTPIIRIMPNTPVAVGEGMIVYTPAKTVTAQEADFFRSMLKAAGVLQEIPETLMDAACAVSGCGPAFVYMFIDALAHGGKACGLPYDEALRLAAQTVRGAAQLLITSEKRPEELTRAVCSPAGSTIEGVHALEDGDFDGVVSAAVKAAFTRAKELANS